MVFQNYMSESFLPYVSSKFEAAQEEEEHSKGNKLQFVIVVVEQSKDGKMFNRGKLLNVGFQVSLRENIDWVSSNKCPTVRMVQS